MPPAAPKPKSPPRPQPRLAYSLPPPVPDVPLYKDDLVTARYLDVPSSGYGYDDTEAWEAPPAAPFGGQHSAVAVTAADSEVTACLKAVLHDKMLA